MARSEGDGTTLATKLVLGAASLGLVRQQLGTRTLGFLAVDVFHQHSFVLKLVSLCLHVEFVVKMTVHLTCLTVLAQQTAQDTHAAHPDNLLGQAGFASTFALTRSAVTTPALGIGTTVHTAARVNDLGLLDDEAIFVELTDTLTGVGIADFGKLIGVEPNLAFATAKYGSGEPLLHAKTNSPPVDL